MSNHLPTSPQYLPVQRLIPQPRRRIFKNLATQALVLCGRKVRCSPPVRQHWVRARKRKTPWRTDQTLWPLTGAELCNELGPVLVYYPLFCFRFLRFGDRSRNLFCGTLHLRLLRHHSAQRPIVTFYCVHLGILIGDRVTLTTPYHLRIIIFLDIEVGIHKNHNHCLHVPMHLPTHVSINNGQMSLLLRLWGVFAPRPRILVNLSVVYNDGIKL